MWATYLFIGVKKTNNHTSPRTLRLRIKRHSVLLPRLSFPTLNSEDDTIFGMVLTRRKLTFPAFKMRHVALRYFRHFKSVEKKISFISANHMCLVIVKTNEHHSLFRFKITMGGPWVWNVNIIRKHRMTFMLLLLLTTTPFPPPKQTKTQFTISKGVSV